MKLLIIQPDCRSYRVPFFKALKEKIGPFTIAHQENPKCLDVPGIEEIQYDKVEILSFKYIKGLTKIIKDFDTIIIGYDIHWLNVIALPLLSSKKIIVWGHGPGKQRILHPLKRKIANKANAIITYSLEGKKAVEALGVSATKVFVAPNTLLVENSEDTTLYKKKTFIFLGRLQERKKLSVFFEAFKAADLEHKNIKITIIGDGDTEKLVLTAKAKELGILDAINFVPGTSNNEELITYFKEAYAYISPGAIGLGILHSFAFGVPVITLPDTLHGPEIAHLVHDNTGYYVNSDEQLSKYLELVTSTYLRLGKNAYKYYKEKASIDMMVSGFVNAINYN